MNQSSEAGEQMVRMSLEGTEVALKLAGKGAKELAVILYAVLKNNTKVAGKTKLSSMLKSGKELKVFTIKEEQLKTFMKQAKRYGVLYSILRSKNNSKDGIVDIMVRGEDAAKINRIVSRFKLSEYKDVTIRNDIEKTRKAQNNDRGVQTKDKNVIIKEQEKTTPIKKDENSLNPSLAKTVKSPLSEPTLEKSSYSQKGIKKKDSVREKLDNYKKEIKKKDKSKTIKREKTKVSTKSKNTKAR